MPTLDWLNRANAFTTATRVPYRLLEQVSIHAPTAQAGSTPVRPEVSKGQRWYIRATVTPPMTTHAKNAWSATVGNKPRGSAL